MSPITVHCVRCALELNKPGAVLLGPPTNVTVQKYHLCGTCWISVFSEIRLWRENAPRPTRARIPEAEE